MTTVPTQQSSIGPSSAAHVLSNAGAPGVAAQSQSAPVNITDFLTDGSLAALCAELSNLAGVEVELRDARGHAIRRSSGSDGSAWHVDAAPSADVPGQSLIPLKLGPFTIGALVVAAGTPVLAVDARSRLEQMLNLLASTTTELCFHELELRHRIKEVAALARMSSLLNRATGPEKVLDVAIELSLDVLGLDAGSIMLMKEHDGELSENEEDLVLATSRNLSQGWLEFPQPLSKDRTFDRLAMTGQVVVSEDLASDDRVLIPQRAAEEGLGAALHAGLVFKNRPLGVIRLYSRTPRSFDDADKRLLASIASQAAVALEQSRLMRLEKEEQVLQRQLQLAADVQRRMLPRGVPNFPNLDVAARYIPSFELGGDFYDFIDLNGHLGLVVGDVVGKGIAAALLMSSVRASLRAFAQDLYDHDEIGSRVNHAMCRDTRDFEFASLWYGVLDAHKMRLTYCSAGHEPPLVVRVPKHRTPTMADMDELTVGGMVVGIDPSQRYQRAVFDIRPGDVLVAYTDGLPDATNFSGERFGKQRVRQALLTCLQEKPNANAGEIVERMLWEVRQWSGLSKTRSDDKTIVAVRVR
ncbi:MAG: PP2C family protein-serine/threonine phosphatase [Phycisphaerae bacterium]